MSTGTEGRSEVIELHLNVRDVAERLGVSVRHVQRMLAAGELTGLKFGAACRIPVSSVRAYIERAKGGGRA
jgi:excisionase family DNA binding protein